MCNSLRGMFSCVFLDRPTVFHRVALGCCFGLLLQAAAPGCCAGVARGPRGVHNICKTHAVYSLFSCVLYFLDTLAFFGFGLWLQELRDTLRLP